MSKKHTIDDTRALFSRLGFELLSDVYLANNKRLQARCAQGHDFSISRANASSGRGCPHCSQKARITQDSLRTIAISNGGALIRPIVPGSALAFRRTEQLAYRSYLFSCAKSHRFERLAHHVRHGAWCPVCAEQDSLAAMKTLASQRGGAALGYARARRHETGSLGINRTHLRAVAFKCSAGHRFKLSPKAIESGEWCPLCSPNLNIASLTSSSAQARNLLPASARSGTRDRTCL